jgi:hypothetical protein
MEGPIAATESSGGKYVGVINQPAAPENARAECHDDEYLAESRCNKTIQYPPSVEPLNAFGGYVLHGVWLNKRLSEGTGGCLASQRGRPPDEEGETTKRAGAAWLEARAGDSNVWQPGEAPTEGVGATGAARLASQRGCAFRPNANSPAGWWNGCGRPSCPWPGSLPTASADALVISHRALYTWMRVVGMVAGKLPDDKRVWALGRSGLGTLMEHHPVLYTKN